MIISIKRMDEEDVEEEEEEEEEEEVYWKESLGTCGVAHASRVLTSA